MRKILGLFIFFSIASACNLNGSSDKYTIEGTVKNHPSKTVLLEKLGLKQVTLIDSSVVDQQGHFTMSGVTETGFYRLKLDNQTSFLFLLQAAPYKVDIDLKNQENPFKITGPAANDEFQKAFADMSAVQQELNGWNQAYQMYGQMRASMDTMMFIQQQLQTLGARFETYIKDSSQTAKNPLVAMFYVTNGPVDKFPKENLAVIKRLEKELPQSSYTKEFREVYDTYEKQSKQQAEMQNTAASVGIGKEAPEIDLKDPNGKNIKLSSLRGKVVLLDFWASWCGPCRVEMPNVVAAYKKYKDKGFAVYSVSLDKEATAWKNSITALGMTWEHNVSDLKFWQSEAAQRYGVNGIPAAFLLDRNGIIVATNLRGAALDQKISEIINN